MASLVTAWAFKAQASSHAKIVLLNLSDNSDRLGRVRFTLETLANDCNLSRVETRALLDELVSKKLIILESCNMPTREIDSWQQALLLINRNSGEVKHVSD